MNFPARGVEIARILYERNPQLVHGDDTQRRQLHKMIAQQMALELPEGTNWGVKSADENRPQSKDAIAFRRNDGLIDIWDIQDGTTRELTVHPNDPPTDPAEAQHFIEVSPFDHIGGEIPIPVPPSTERDCSDEILALKEMILQLTLEVNALKNKPAPQLPPITFPTYRGSIFGIGITLRPE